MRRCGWLLMLALAAAGCAGSANVEQERSAVLAVDREWAQSTTDLDKFMSYFAQDATVYAPGAPAARGSDAIRAMTAEMINAPGFSLTWTPDKADVATSGEVAYSTGSYDLKIAGATEKGKYVTVWKKQADGSWKVAEDIFNADTPLQGPPAQHLMVAPSALKWGDSPPTLPPGARFAVVSGDPTQAQPFVIRVQAPADWRVPPHWHPSAENLTVLTGTVALGMGDTFDESKMQELAAGGFGIIPADMHHYFLARTASTFQVHGTGPFAITYVNPADDPSKAAK